MFPPLGSYGMEENLLHFCIRRRLTGMAEFLLQPKLILGRAQLLQGRAHDGKTPVELARKSGMKRVNEMVEKSVVCGPLIARSVARESTSSAIALSIQVEAGETAGMY